MHKQRAELLSSPARLSVYCLQSVLRPFANGCAVHSRPRRPVRPPSAPFTPCVHCHHHAVRHRLSEEERQQGPSAGKPTSSQGCAPVRFSSRPTWRPAPWSASATGCTAPMARWPGRHLRIGNPPSARLHRRRRVCSPSAVICAVHDLRSVWTLWSVLLQPAAQVCHRIVHLASLSTQVLAFRWDAHSEPAWAWACHRGVRKENSVLRHAKKAPLRCFCTLSTSPARSAAATAGYRSHSPRQFPSRLAHAAG